MEGSESFLNLSGNGAVCYDNGGCQPPWWPAQSLSVFKNKPNVSVAFFLLHFFYFKPQIYWEDHAASGLYIKSESMNSVITLRNRIAGFSCYE